MPDEEIKEFGLKGQLGMSGYEIIAELKNGGYSKVSDVDKFYILRSKSVSKERIRKAIEELECLPLWYDVVMNDYSLKTIWNWFKNSLLKEVE